jgi:hypothetical protein
LPGRHRLVAHGLLPSADRVPSDPPANQTPPVNGAHKYARLVSAYNYDRFDEYVATGVDEREFGQFPNALHAGERAPDGELLLLGGSSLRLSEAWRDRGVVLEFGSFT